MRGLRVFGVLLSLACTAPEAASEQSELVDRGRLVVSATLFTAPSAGDGAPVRLYAWERGGPAGLPAAHEAFEQGADVVLRTPERVLFRFVDGDPTRRIELAREVLDAPAVTADALAFVVVDEGPQGTASVLHRIADGRDLVLDRTLYALGGLRFAPDGRTVIGVGSVNGGVAGLHAFDDEGRRCLTNCDARVGSPPDQWQPLPSGALRFEGGEAAWEDDAGRTHVVTWRRP
ncbi:MAG: hypothetical protein H6724_08170 [Sandaracinus sp.]|nr:hypothetical protein [Sandaracinus sp.]